MAELDGASPGALVSRFVYGSRPNVPDLVIRDGQMYRLLVDHLGSPREAVSIQGGVPNIPYRVDYNAFGVAQAADGLGSSMLSWIPFGFAGGLYDSDAGLIHFGARDYDPVVGRWISKDPIVFDGAQTNIYAYVGNDPVNHADPSGLFDPGTGAVVVSSGPIGWAVAAAALGVGAAVYQGYGLWKDLFPDVGGPGSCTPPPTKNGCQPCPEPPPGESRHDTGHSHWPCPGDHIHYYDYEYNQKCNHMRMLSKEE